MISKDAFRKLALPLPDAVEQPHFEKISFSINKKIFTTLDFTNGLAVVKLSEIDQSIFCNFDSTIIYPVKGSWGKKGWTTIELKRIKKNMLIESLSTSYKLVSNKKVRSHLKNKIMKKFIVLSCLIVNTLFSIDKSTVLKYIYHIR